MVGQHERADHHDDGHVALGREVGDHRDAQWVIPQEGAQTHLAGLARKVARLPLNARIVLLQAQGDVAGTGGSQATQTMPGRITGPG